MPIRNSARPVSRLPEVSAMLNCFARLSEHLAKTPEVNNKPVVARICGGSSLVIMMTGFWLAHSFGVNGYLVLGHQSWHRSYRPSGASPFYPEFVGESKAEMIALARRQPGLQTLARLSAPWPFPTPL